MTGGGELEWQGKSPREVGLPSTATPAPKARVSLVAHLVAESLDIHLSQLLAAHQALNPPIQRRDGGGLSLNGRDVGRRPPDILHVSIHV